MNRSITIPPSRTLLSQIFIDVQIFAGIRVLPDFELLPLFAMFLKFATLFEQFIHHWICVTHKISLLLCTPDIVGRVGIGSCSPTAKCSNKLLVEHLVLQCRRLQRFDIAGDSHQSQILLEQFTEINPFFGATHDNGEFKFPSLSINLLVAIAITIRIDPTRFIEQCSSFFQILRYWFNVYADGIVISRIPTRSWVVRSGTGLVETLAIDFKHLGVIEGIRHCLPDTRITKIGCIGIPLK